MKKFFILLFVLTAFSGFAQETAGGSKKVSPFSIGVSGFAYIPTQEEYLIGQKLSTGGGFGVKFKWNFNRFFGLSTDFDYSNSKTNMTFFDITANVINIRESLVFQYETYRGESGFVPWVSVGVGAAIAVPEINVFNTAIPLPDDTNGTGFNVNVSAGLKYNFKNFYTGIFVDWTYSLAYTNSYVALGNRSTNAYTLDAVRTGVEVGYRF